MAVGVRKILLVDDDDMVRDLVAATLKGGDYQLLQAADGGKGLELTREHRPEALGGKPRAAELVGGVAQTSTQVRPFGRRLIQQRDEEIERHLTRSYRAGLTIDQRYVKRSS